MKADQSPLYKTKTANNVLSVLSTLLNVAEDWDVIDEVKCWVKRLKVTKPKISFHDLDHYKRLITASAQLS